MLDLSSRKVYGALAEQCVGGDAKADKVETAVAGHLAGLDSNGNLTDSGVSPTEEVTVEGNPVTFDSPFEQDAKSVVVTVKPIQDLHGYDNPWPAGGEKNKLPCPTNETKSSSGITVSVNNGVFSVSGLATAGTIILFDLPETISLPSGYFISLLNTFSNSAVNWLFSNENGVSVLEVSCSPTNKVLELTQAYTGIKKIGVYVSNGVNLGTNVNSVSPMLLVSNTDTSPFLPYSNECPISGIDEVEIEVSDGESEPTTTTIPLPSTLYDADVDVTNGAGTDAMGFVDMGTLTFSSFSSSIGAYYCTIDNILVPANDNTPLSAICSKYNIVAYNNWNFDYSISCESNGRVIVKDPTLIDKTDEEVKAAMSGVQLCYELATPTTISFDPTDVELLEGTNVVSTNGEKVAVTYGRSLWQDIDKLKTDTEGKLDKSNVADVEGANASKPYSVNEFMLRSDGFYRVTQPIASGASITASNTTKTTIGAVLTALLNA